MSCKFILVDVFVLFIGSSCRCMLWCTPYLDSMDKHQRANAWPILSNETEVSTSWTTEWIRSVARLNSRWSLIVNASYTMIERSYRRPSVFVHKWHFQILRCILCNRWIFGPFHRIESCTWPQMFIPFNSLCRNTQRLWKQRSVFNLSSLSLSVYLLFWLCISVKEVGMRVGGKFMDRLFQYFYHENDWQLNVQEIYI